MRSVPVDKGTLTVERTDSETLEFTRDHGDGVQHKSHLYVFPKHVFEELRACVPQAQARAAETKRSPFVKWVRKFLPFWLQSKLGIRNEVRSN